MASTMEALECRPLSSRPQGGYREICSGGTSPGVFVMCHPNRFPGNRQWSADDPTPYCSSGWIICVDFHFQRWAVGSGRRRAQIGLEFRVVPRLRAAIASRDL